ncbi:hypothetical protein [Geomicrobium sp. JCM 19055]|uniref:hypothetical protein n=1 Tax=Geomicrobium sp. JCM 19055 TaxID=1460649 RepID=UPI00045ECD6B|nr:hypothetical protein [Geomicrobium sp. JCM 19055]GAK01486.1 hypothetical protein JCM19055_4652 [Geomicrobium sp. JCM 19055]
MTEEQALYIMESISDVYPRFELSEKKIEFMIPGLLKMEYTKVVDNLKRHVAEKPFPPTLSEIAAYPSAENDTLAKMEQWEQEAANVPQETKDQFRKELQRLMKEKGNE